MSWDNAHTLRQLITDLTNEQLGAPPPPRSNVKRNESLDGVTGMFCNNSKTWEGDISFTIDAPACDLRPQNQLQGNPVVLTAVCL